jgi:hypothetical protein
VGGLCVGLPPSFVESISLVPFRSGRFPFPKQRERGDTGLARHKGPPSLNDSVNSANLGGARKPAQV